MKKTEPVLKSCLNAFTNKKKPVLSKTVNTISPSSVNYRESKTQFQQLNISTKNFTKDRDRPIRIYQPVLQSNHNSIIAATQVNSNGYTSALSYNSFVKSTALIIVPGLKVIYNNLRSSKAEAAETING